MARIDPLRVLMARAQARAFLFAACEYETLDQAVDPLLRYAYNTRLFQRYGADAIYAMIEKAFARCQYEQQKEARQNVNA